MSRVVRGEDSARQTIVRRAYSTDWESTRPFLDIGVQFSGDASTRQAARQHKIFQSLKGRLGRSLLADREAVQQVAQPDFESRQDFAAAERAVPRIVSVPLSAL